MQRFQILVGQISQKMHAMVATLYGFQHLAVFQKIESGGKQPWPLIWTSTAHGHLLQPDGEREQGKRGTAGEAPAGGEGLQGGSVVTEGGRGSVWAAVASPERHHSGSTASAAVQLRVELRLLLCCPAASW